MYIFGPFLRKDLSNYLYSDTWFEYAISLSTLKVCVSVPRFILITRFPCLLQSREYFVNFDFPSTSLCKCFSLITASTFKTYSIIYEVQSRNIGNPISSAFFYMLAVRHACVLKICPAHRQPHAFNNDDLLLRLCVGYRSARIGS